MTVRLVRLAVLLIPIGLIVVAVQWSRPRRCSVALSEIVAKKGGIVFPDDPVPIVDSTNWLAPKMVDKYWKSMCSQLATELHMESFPVHNYECDAASTLSGEFYNSQCEASGKRVSEVVDLLSWIPTMKVVFLDFNRVTSDDIDKLAMCSSIEALGLSGTGISSSEIERLSPLFNLRILRCTDTSIDDSAIPGMLKLTRLTTIDVSRTRITESGISVLADHHPSVETIGARHLGWSKKKEAEFKRRTGVTVVGAGLFDNLAESTNERLAIDGLPNVQAFRTTPFSTRYKVINQPTPTVPNR